MCCCLGGTRLLANIVPQAIAMVTAGAGVVAITSDVAAMPTPWCHGGYRCYYRPDLPWHYHSGAAAWAKPTKVLSANMLQATLEICDLHASMLTPSTLV